MALMFPRLARNFAKNGYYPTDESTLERALSALAPSDGPMCILDPCAGEGVAIAEAAHALGHAQVRAYAVEYDQERANHARLLVDHCIHGDLMDTLVSRQSFSLLWLNPPYGDLCLGRSHLAPVAPGQGHMSTAAAGPLASAGTGTAARARHAPNPAGGPWSAAGLSDRARCPGSHR